MVGFEVQGLSADVIQFGTKQPGQDYAPRPGAYALVFDDAGKILVVDEGGFFWLPGGGLDGDETLEAGLRREMLEETGYAFEIITELGRANEFTQDPINRRFFDKRCVFFTVRLVGGQGTPQASGNRPAWITPGDALDRLHDETHRWALRRELASRLG